VSKSLQKFERSDKTAGFPFLVLAVSIFLTVGISYIFYQSSKSKDSIRFSNEVSRLQMTFENKINLYIALLKGGRGFVESNPVINRETFADYIESLNFDKNYTGIQGIGYAKVVASGDRALLTQKMKVEGYQDFQIYPLTEKEFYEVVLYLEPSGENNRKMIGFDMSSEAARRNALERARDSGEAATSSKIVSIQDDAANATGFFICLPIYKNRKLPASVEERRRNITGYIYSPFLSNAFLQEIQSSESVSDVAVKLYDGEPAAVPDGRPGDGGGRRRRVGPGSARPR